jgi:hypothetical protein
MRLRYVIILVRYRYLVSSKSTLWRRHAMQSAMCKVLNVKCNVQTGVLAVQGLSASVLCTMDLAVSQTILLCMSNIQ